MTYGVSVFIWLFDCRYTYFGEFALSFAAVLGQEACVRLLLRKGADANLQDTNGCTVLHLLVIHDKKVRFNPIYALKKCIVLTKYKLKM